MNDAAPNSPPFLCVSLTDHDDVDRNPKVPQLAQQPHRLPSLVVNFRLNDQKIHVADQVRLSSRMGAKQNHARVRCCRGEPPTCLGDQAFIDYRHGIRMVDPDSECLPARAAPKRPRPGSPSTKR